MRLFKTALLLCLFVLSGCVAVIESNEMMKRTQALLNTDFQGTTIKDLEYAEGKYHHYDLYLPVDKTNTRSQKLILFVHGGGWTSGSKEDGENWCRYFAHQGYTTAALDYSLQTKGQTPSIDDMVEEMHLCIEAIVAKTAEEGITLDEMALNGFSAGGCLALLFAYRETPELPLKFVIEQSAPTTFDPKEWEEGVHWFVTHTTGVNGSAEGDTLVIPTNGGRIIESNVYLKLLSFDESTDDADLLLYGINNGVWENLGYFFTDWAFYGNHGYDWNRTNIIDQMNTQQYEQIAIVYSGHGTIWALDDWDYTTTQATTMEFLIEDRVVNDTVYDVTGLNPADDHYYFVKARNSQYTSEKSESVECFGLAAPTMHEATGITEDSYTANWEAHPKADKTCFTTIMCTPHIKQNRIMSFYMRTSRM